MCFHNTSGKSNLIMIQEFQVFVFDCICDYCYHYSNKHTGFVFIPFFLGKCFKKNYWISSEISFFYLKVQSFWLIMENGKQWLILGASVFQCIRAGFLCLKCANFACLHTRQDQNEIHLKRWFFFAKIGIFCKSIAGLLPSVVQAYT